MAVLETSINVKTRENMKKLPKNDKKQVKKVLLVAQEVKLARVLAGNNKIARDRAIKSLKKWFQNRATAMPFTDDDFLRLWKGLFYSMWMSDKPLIQEECAENISNLVHALPLEAALLFFKAGMISLMNEWFGIDQLRLDKFLMFVRRLLRQCLFVLKHHNWTHDCVKKFSDLLSETILDTQRQKPIGLLMHFIEIYLEELAKVSAGDLSPTLMPHFLAPFIKQLAFIDDSRIIDHIRKHVFIYLIRQSDLGLEYDEKYQAWRDLGFPGSIDCMKKVEAPEDEHNDEDEEAVVNTEETIYDPRAGRVNVDLPQLKFHPKAIVKALSEWKFDRETNSKSRRSISELIEKFKKLSSGIYPLGVKKVKLASTNIDTSIRKAVNRLVKFDQKIKGKKNKKRKIQNGNSDEIELRGGKKIRLDERLHEIVEKELNNITNNPEKRLKLMKRKIMDSVEMPPKKIIKKEQNSMQIESTFTRNSGTWLVTKTPGWDSEESETEENRDKVIYPKNSWVERANHAPQPEAKQPKARIIFPSSRWEKIQKSIAEYEENEVKKNRLSLPSELIKNPFATPKLTPVKKVKINTKLNRSQDVQEHHAQILSSPAIPYDANKKPSKPLLKTPNMTSPINPFYSL